MIRIRPALPSDPEALSDLAARSEAHWGDDPAFLAAFREHYRVTGEYLARNKVFVAEEEGSILGFYALADGAEGLELDYMYLEPSLLGRGLGRRLWEHMADYCRAAGTPTVHLVCSPGPKAFYLRMGAVEAGAAESLVAPGRKVSRLVYRIP
ncbi:MAG TPA: GNAT family N-acetyltransferase [Holophaga sp.]|nr:GNAT family N-acetyltransferase [Holophaga sp.]